MVGSRPALSGDLAPHVRLALFGTYGAGSFEQGPLKCLGVNTRDLMWHKGLAYVMELKILRLRDDPALSR